MWNELDITDRANGEYLRIILPSSSMQYLGCEVIIYSSFQQQLAQGPQVPTSDVALCNLRVKGHWWFQEKKKKIRRIRNKADKFFHDFWVVLCGARSLIWWSSWVPFNSRYSMVLWFYANGEELPDVIKSIVTFVIHKNVCHWWEAGAGISEMK